MIIRKNKFILFLEQKDYHSVPEILGRSKKLAEYFKNQWERLVGSCDFIFIRTLDGRKILLKSSIKLLAAQFDDKVEHVNKWGEKKTYITCTYTKVTIQQVNQALCYYRSLCLESEVLKIHALIIPEPITVIIRRLLNRQTIKEYEKSNCSIQYDT